MVVFFESGRLGNQIMQYAALRGRFGGERLLLFGFGALAAAVAASNTWFVPHRGLLARPVELLRRTLDLLVRWRLVGDAWEEADAGSARLQHRPGLWRGLTRVRVAYFHHPDFARAAPRDLALRPAAMAEARRWLDERLGPGRPALFLHLRRGDYLSYPSPEAPAVLDDAWVLDAVARLRERLGALPLVVCSDELPYARRLLHALPDVHACDRGELGDLAVMAHCDGGVLSPSSFSWWAAFLARRRLGDEADTAGREPRFIAPRHWIGHRRGQWYPEGFRFDWIDYR